MRYSLEHKKKTRDAILCAAGKLFRAEGYGGSGIDGLTRAAGVTNGAFYGHFKTKAEAFAEIVSIGLGTLRDGLRTAQATHGETWLETFLEYYLGAKRTCALGDACALPMLSAEVARADPAARAVYDARFKEVVTAMAEGLGGDEAKAVAILALLSGASTFARALPDQVMGAELARTVRDAALKLAASPVG